MAREDRQTELLYYREQVGHPFWIGSTSFLLFDLAAFEAGWPLFRTENQATGVTWERGGDFSDFPENEMSNSKYDQRQSFQKAWAPTRL